ISRTYCGTSLRGITPDRSTIAGSRCVAVSIVTMSPELMVRTGLRLARKKPTCTVCGLGMSVNSAARSALPESVTASAAAIAARHEDRRWENLIFRLADCWQIAEFPASRPGASPDSKDVAHPLPNL